MCETSNADHLTRCEACGAAKVEKVWPPHKPPVPPVKPPVTPPHKPPVKPPVSPLPPKVWGHTWLYYLLRWFTSSSFLYCFISLPDQDFTPLIAFIVFRILLYCAFSSEKSSGRSHIPFLDTHNADLVSAAHADTLYWIMFFCWVAPVAFLLYVLYEYYTHTYLLPTELFDVLFPLTQYSFSFFAPLSDILFDRKIYAHLQETRP